MTDWPERLARHEAEQYEEPEAAVQRSPYFGWTALALALLGWLCVGAIVLGIMAVLWGIG